MTETTPTTDELIAHFVGRLAFETDPTGVHHEQEAGTRFVLIDSRGDAAWAQGRIRGAVHLPTAQIAARAPAEVPIETPVVTYCWGPGCNGATRAALEFARLGYPVKEMIGGFEYWAREGFPVEDDHGPVHRETDPLTSAVASVTCDC
ncbi:rhodanese-like domain-containing protein [Tersicoccus sp. MR15.9]|uniref:rhodanese-like domain-containing protein n=1 Tax=Tersicoccus mangrovi TaxID=3121635 RepID=UPI002FE5C3CB